MAKKKNKPTIQDAFDDLTSRFILNLPDEELKSFERIFFQLEQAQWFYADFYSDRHKHLPHLSLKSFCQEFFTRCPLLQPHLSSFDTQFAKFRKYLGKVPVCGVILLTPSMDKCLMVQSFFGVSWSYPKGKINKDEQSMACAARECKEEVGYDPSHLLTTDNFITASVHGKTIRLYIARGVDDRIKFKTQTKKEIGAIRWFPVRDLPKALKQEPLGQGTQYSSQFKFRNVGCFTKDLWTWVHEANARDALHANQFYSQYMPQQHQQQHHNHNHNNQKQHSYDQYNRYSQYDPNQQQQQQQHADAYNQYNANTSNNNQADGSYDQYRQYNGDGGGNGNRNDTRNGRGNAQQRGKKTRINNQHRHQHQYQNGNIHHMNQRNRNGGRNGNGNGNNNGNGQYNCNRDHNDHGGANGNSYRNSKKKGSHNNSNNKRQSKHERPHRNEKVDALNDDTFGNTRLDRGRWDAHEMFKINETKFGIKNTVPASDIDPKVQAMMKNWSVHDTLKNYAKLREVVVNSQYNKEGNSKSNSKQQLQPPPTKILKKDKGRSKHNGNTDGRAEVKKENKRSGNTIAHTANDNGDGTRKCKDRQHRGKGAMTQSLKKNHSKNANANANANSNANATSSACIPNKNASSRASTRGNKAGNDASSFTFDMSDIFASLNQTNNPSVAV